MREENMIEDKNFLVKEMTPNVLKLVEESKKMIEQRITLPKMFDYILTHSKDHREMNITLFLFGIAYQSYKEDNHLK
jgi:hypothetical protein